MSTVRIQVRRGLAADWSSVNPVLAAGEMGYETDTNKFKFGNGTGTWSTLAYGASDTPGVTEIAQDAINAALSVGTGITKTYNDGANTITVAIDDAVWASKTYVDEHLTGLQNTSDATYLLQSDRGTAGGVAALDNAGKVPSDQIANSTIRNAISVAGNGINYNASSGELNLDFSNNPDALASQGYVATQVSNIVNNAPGALDTLMELSLALGNDADFGTNIVNNIALKAPINSPTFTGVVTIPSGALIADYDTIAYRESAITAALNTAATDATTKANAAVDTAVANAATAAAATYLPLSNVTEVVTDTAAGMISVGSGNGLTRTWDDTNNSLTLSVDHGVIATLTAVATAKQEAIDAAADDATTKAQDAISTAAADATTKSNNAETAAISAAGIAADSKVSAHSSDTTDVHGIADTAALATKTYVDNAGSALQSNIDAKAPIASPTFTGTVSGITKAMVGLGNLDNTSDANKPVSTATQAALDLKAPKAAPTFTGTLTAADVTISGNLTVSGTTTTVNTTNFTTADPLIYLGEGNNANLVDLGFVGSYNDGTYAHQGLVKDASDGKWKLFKGVTDEPTTTINFNQGSLDALKVGAFEATTVTPSAGVVFSDGTQTKEGVPSRTTILSKTADYTLAALTERDNMIEMNSSSATVLYVPTDASVNYPIGTTIDILRVGSGAVSVAASTPATTTINATPGLKLRAQWSSATLMKRAANTWVLLGDLSA